MDVLDRSSIDWATMELNCNPRKLYITAERDLIPELHGGLENLRNKSSLDDGNVLLVDLKESDIQSFIWLICEVIPQNRWNSVRCCTSASETTPSPGQLMRSENLDLLRKKVDAVWLQEIIDDDRLITFFQPIISNKTPYRVAAYECLIRGLSKNEQLITPWQLFSAAKAANLTNRLDHAARLKSIETAKRLRNDVNIFINFNPKYISDTLTDLAETMEAVLGSGVDPRRFVFEVVESDEIHDMKKLHEVLSYCRRIGCRVALDDVGAGYNSLNNLPEVRPDFIKLDMELARDVETDHYKSRVASKLLELARELNLISIVEGIETVGSWNWVRAHGADFSQGFLFAKPAAVPPNPTISPEDFVELENREVFQNS